MHSASWDVDEVPRLGVDRLTTRLESGGSLQDIKGFGLVVVKVRRRASSWRKQTLNNETASVRFRARGQKRYPVARPAIHRPGSCRHMLGLISILRDCVFFHDFNFVKCLLCLL